MIDFATIIAVDREHAEQLRLVWPTWARHRPEILQRPIVLVCDAKEFPEDRRNLWRLWCDRLAFVNDHPGVDALMLPWFWRPDLPQRERMLTSLVRIPAMLPAEHWPTWWLKLDTDAVALRPGDWIQDVWFAADADGPAPVIVASPWGYAKPGDVVERLDRWGNEHPELSQFPELGYRPVPGSEIVRYPRIISWCCFLRADFCRWASGLVPAGERLPVPSQDTYAHYVAVRSGQRVRTVRMKPFGWDHVRKTRTLERLAGEALRIQTG